MPKLAHSITTKGTSMKLKPFSLYTLTNLVEAKAGKLTHLDHAEELIINDGSRGAEEVLDLLYDLSQHMAGSSDTNSAVSVKWDGAPAVIFGVNPDNKKFFVGTKGVFAQNPKICYTKEDVNNWYSGELANKLIQCLAYLPELNPRGVLQGDLMFTKGDIQTREMEGEECYIFRPNTITYAVPVNSEIGDRIEKAQIGIVIHTSYEGESFAEMKAKFGYDVSVLSESRRVWYVGATVKDLTGIVKLSEEETHSINAYLNMARGSLKRSASLLDELSAGMTNQWSVGPRLKVYFNSRVRNNKEFVNVKEMQADFEQYYLNSLSSEADKKSTEAGKSKYTDLAIKGKQLFEQRKSEIYMAIACYVSIHNAKELLIKKLNKLGSVKSFAEIKPGQFKVTDPEGYVLIKGDKAVKLVSRMNFSALNFNLEKTWDK